MTLVTADIEMLGPMRSDQVCAALAIGSKGNAGAVTFTLITSP
jgi:hypothetical protein